MSSMSHLRSNQTLILVSYWKEAFCIRQSQSNCNHPSFRRFTFFENCTSSIDFSDALHKLKFNKCLQNINSIILHREYGIPWTVHAALFSEIFDLNFSTARSTNRALVKPSTVLVWIVRHSGHGHSFSSRMFATRHEWQKLWPQRSVIRIGALNISLSVSKKVNSFVS